MNSKHTAGPLHYEATNHGESVMTSQGVIVATVKRYTGHTEQAVADAILYAAAPELLAACELVFGEWLCGKTLDAGSPAYDDIRAALAKAKGEA